MFQYKEEYYLFDGYLYDFYEIDKKLFDLLSLGDGYNILKEINSLTELESVEKNLLKLSSLFLYAKFEKPIYISDNKTAYLSLNTGNRCNLNCRYCFRNKLENKKSDYKVIKDSIDFFIRINQNAEHYSIAMDLSSEVFLERDILVKVIDYFAKKECYLFDEDEFLIGTALDFYKMLPNNIKTVRCKSDSQALFEINNILKRKDLLKKLNIEKHKEENQYLFQESKKCDILPLWKLIRLNHWGLEALYPKYIKHKQRKSFSLYFMSNGTLITEDDIKLIKGLEINPFEISLDGPEKIHNSLRPYTSGKGCYQDVIKSIKLLQNNNIDVKISLVLTNIYPKPFELVIFLLTLKVSKVKMTLIRNNKELEFVPSSIESLLEDYKKLFDKLFEDLLNNDFSLFKFLSDDVSLRPLHNLINKNQVVKRCLWDEEIVIDGKGNIYPCPYTIGNEQFIRGNIYKGYTKKRFNKNLFIDNRIKCKKCWARYLCGGTCYFNTYMKTSVIQQSEPIECILNKFFCKMCIQLFFVIRKNNISVEQIFN